MVVDSVADEEEVVLVNREVEGVYRVESGEEVTYRLWGSRGGVQVEVEGDVGEGEDGEDIRWQKDILILLARL